MIRVLLAEDQGMVLGALAALLALEPDIEVVGRARDGGEALALVRSQRPDVVVTDIEMPGMTGLELAQAVRHELDGAVRVVILTTFARPGYLRRALEAGVSGYLLKEAPAEQLARALRRVHGGGRVVDPELAAEAWGEADPLTDRERQVLNLIAEGFTGRQIAEQLGLRPKSVENHRALIMSMLGINSTAGLVRYALQVAQR